MIVGRKNIKKWTYQKGKKWRRGMGKPVKIDMRGDDKACMISGAIVALVTALLLILLYFLFRG